MTRIHDGILCAAVIILMITAGCNANSSNARPMVTDTTAVPATPVPSAPVMAGTAPAGAAGTQAPGTCSADLSSDAGNCGGCGYACPANALCQQGQCYCKEGYTVENNACVTAAGTGTSGTGTAGSGNGCPAGMNPCPDGYCYDLTSSATNCGICGNICSAGMICSASTCTNVPTEATTAPATTVTTTVTTTTTGSSSGTDFHVVGPAVVSKACFVFGETNCGGTCVNTSTSNGNCGSCGNICSGLKATCCNGACTSLKTDKYNCGTCGTTCKVIGSVCEEGSCKVKTAVIVSPGVVVKPSIQIIQPGLQFP